MRDLCFGGGKCAVILLLLGAGAASSQAASTGSGQEFPNKSLRIVTAEPGGGSDFAARLMAQGLTGLLGQPVIVENRTGSGTVAPEIVLKAPADGYTLFVAGSAFWVGPLVRKATYDPAKDFATITMLVNFPNILVVHPSSPVNSVKELIALARAKPGELNYTSAGVGSSSHLAAELLKNMAAVNFVHIATKGGGPAIIALVGGQVQLSFATPASVASLIKSGKLRAVAVTSAKPSGLAPGLPTVAETVPGYQIGGATGMFAPRATPAAIVGRLNREAVRLLSQSDVKEKFFNVGSEAVGNSPQEFAAMIKSEMTRLSKVIKEAGIRAE